MKWFPGRLGTVSSSVWISPSLNSFRNLCPRDRSPPESLQRSGWSYFLLTLTKLFPHFIYLSLTQSCAQLGSIHLQWGAPVEGPKVEMKTTVMGRGRCSLQLCIIHWGPPAGWDQLCCSDPPTSPPQVTPDLCSWMCYARCTENMMFFMGVVSEHAGHVYTLLEQSVPCNGTYNGNCWFVLVCILLHVTPWLRNTNRTSKNPFFFLYFIDFQSHHNQSCSKLRIVAFIFGRKIVLVVTFRVFFHNWT